MKAVLLALALILTACSGSRAEDEPPPRPTHIAILGSDGNLSIYDPESGLITAVTSDAGAGRRYSQPTWSPDGSRLAFVTSAVPATGIQASGGRALVAFQAQAEMMSSIHIFTIDGAEPAIVETPFLPFYLYWAPDGTKLAFLGNDASTSGQGFGILDTGTGTAERIDSGQPYFFAWSPDSDRLLIHAADTELYYLALDGAKQPLEPTPGSFSAPGWRGDTQLYPVLEGDRQILRLSNPDGTARRDATDFESAIALRLNPDEERVAYIEIVPGANPFGLGALVVDAPTGATELTDLAASFFWSADGSQLLYLTPDISDDEFGLRWNVWDGAESIAFERFLPTPTFFQEYLPFSGQYSNSLSFFSPDGSSFTFAGTIPGRGEGIWTQSVVGDVPAQLVGPGQFATWAPRPTLAADGSLTGDG